MGTELFHVERWMDGHDKAKSLFCNFTKALKNDQLCFRLHRPEPDKFHTRQCSSCPSLISIVSNIRLSAILKPLVGEKME
jgi:hypothetical protein